ncbi:MAG: gamma-glutamylcyclotransferase [Lentisphaeria bacterium]
MREHLVEDFAKCRDTLLYFAYGSNMDPELMSCRIGNWLDRTVAYLENYQLLFNKHTGDGYYGFANIGQKKDAKVWGIIYEIDPHSLTALDTYQGVPNHYTRNIIEVKTSSGKCLKAITYLANPGRIGNNLVPREEYLEHLLRADTHLQRLPNEYMQFLRTFNEYNRNADRYFNDLEENTTLEHLFVYGSLKSNQCNNKNLKNSDFVYAEAINIALHRGPFYPFARRCSQSTTKGELYLVNRETLRKLDLFEGHPNFHRREKVQVRLDDGKIQEAWIYLCDDAFSNPPITEGIWP